MLITDKSTTAENPYIIKFGKPYIFEDETFNSVDLSEIENITASDMIATQKAMSKNGIEALPEMSLEYCCIIAARVTGKPIEFFTGLPARDAVKLKNVVTGFIFGAD